MILFTPRKPGGPHAVDWTRRIAVCSGIVIGLAAYTFYYAKGFSYMSSNSEVCVNCHIMQSQYDTWGRSSHHAVAGCVDCHLPHAIAGKYFAKAENGFHHSKAFTLQNFNEPIIIKEKNSRILQKNCLRCHGMMANDIAITSNAGGHSCDAPVCVHCHQSVGHGEQAGLGGPLTPSEIREVP